MVRIEVIFTSGREKLLPPWRLNGIENRDSIEAAKKGDREESTERN